MGAVLWQEKPGGVVWIQHVVKGSAAEESGVLPGDQVMSVDDMTVGRGWDAVAVAHAMGGERGTMVRLKMMGGGQGPREGVEYSVELARS